MTVVFFLDNDVSAETLSAVEEDLRQSGLFSRIRLIDREKALSHFQEKFPDLEGIVAGLDSNPFPPSFEALIPQACPLS